MQVERAMQQIFAMKLLARDLEVAARVSEAANLDCITLEGDEASRKGSMQVGAAC
jgi:structural maintenance of chromosome 3 (chondroitin sulfate proteoglycan 6)